MNLLLIPSLKSSSNKIIITDSAQIHHLRDVLRIKTGEIISVSDGRGNGIRASIGRISPKGIELVVKSRINPAAKKMHLTIACAIPKKSKFDEIIDKLTQFGVDRIIPLKTERTIVKITREREEAKINRWLKVALNASQQCQRVDLPEVAPLTDVKALIRNSSDFQLKLIPTLEGNRKGIKEVISKTQPSCILVLIGPEGDFTDEEINLAKEEGFIPVSLGPLVLRVETAAVAVASFINLYENPHS